MRRLLRDTGGQATVEYALVTLAAAAIALGLLLWAVRTSLLSQFFNAVVRKVLGVVTGTPLG